MENNIIEFPDEIEALLFTRDFEELSPYEVRSVLGYMTEEEYSIKRLLIRMSKGRLQDRAVEIAPEPSTKYRLENALRRRHMKRAPFRRYFDFLGYQVPVYRFALTFLILATVYFSVDSGSDPRVEYITERDTVYLEKPYYIYDTVFAPVKAIKTRTVSGSVRSRFIGANGKYGPGNEVPMYYSNNVESVLEVSRKQKYGSSCSDDEKFMQYLTKVY